MTHTEDRIARSIIYMVLGSLSFSIMATFVKYACQTLPAFEVVFFRSFFGSIAIVIWMSYKKVSFIGKNPKINALRGIFGFAALTLHFYCISTLDLGTAVMLNFTAPLFVVILAFVILREKTSVAVGAAIVFSFMGLYMLAAPRIETHLFPLILGIFCGIFAAVAFTLIRFSRNEESPFTIIFYFTAISTVASLPLLAFGFEWPNGQEWLGLIGVTTGAFFGQIFLTMSIQGAPISTVMPFSYLTPVFATGFGFALWQERLELPALLGSAIIIVCGIATYAFRKKPGFVPLEE